MNMVDPERLTQAEQRIALLRDALRAKPPARPDVSEQASGITEFFADFIENREPELAMNCLEDIAALVPCPPEFWRLMERIAMTMNLEEESSKFRENSRRETRLAE
jgi:hypothetical protein